MSAQENKQKEQTSILPPPCDDPSMHPGDVVKGAPPAVGGRCGKEEGRMRLFFMSESQDRGRRG
jgi:hypothetical protein